MLIVTLSFVLEKFDGDYEFRYVLCFVKPFLNVYHVHCIYFRQSKTNQIQMEKIQVLLQKQTHLLWAELVAQAQKEIQAGQALRVILVVLLIHPLAITSFGWQLD